MIITVNDIRKVRQVAKNIDDSRVEIYIREAESLDILPAVGAEEYDRLTAATPDPALSEDEQLLLSGGTYEDAGGVKRRFEGLKAALAYLAYARFVRNHQLNVTPFGVVFKDGDESTQTDVRAIAAASKDAERIGQEYLAGAMAFWKGRNPSGCKPGPGGRPRRRFIPIGD